MYPESAAPPLQGTAHVPPYSRKRPTLVTDDNGDCNTRPLSARQLTLVALAVVWVALSITVGYYVGEPYLRKSGDTQRPRAARQNEAVPIASSRAPAEGGFAHTSTLREPDRAEMGLLRGEVARLRFWLLLAMIIQAVVGCAIVGYLVSRGRRFGRRLMHQLARLSAPAVSSEAQQNGEAAPPPLPADKPPSSWPPATGESQPLSALTACLRRNREAIAHSRIEMENHSAADFTLCTRQEAV